MIEGWGKGVISTLRENPRNVPTTASSLSTCVCSRQCVPDKTNGQQLLLKGDANSIRRRLYIQLAHNSTTQRRSLSHATFPTIFDSVLPANSKTSLISEFK